MAEDIRITGENAQCVYYCSRMISAQYGTEFVKSNYQNVWKVYSIWISLDVPKEWENTITCYHIVEENLVGAPESRSKIIIC